MTTMTVDIKFITAPVDLGAMIHAATAVGYEYNTLCGRSYPHDAPEYRFVENGKTLEDICPECKGEMVDLGMPIDGRAMNALGIITSAPNLFRAVQHLFEAARHIEGYAKNCPVCGGTQVDADEGCRMCLPLFQMIEDAKTITDMANAILLVEDPFEITR